MEWSKINFLLPVSQASKLLLLGFLDETRLGCQRLRDIHDKEALHDFRVGLRRLRSAWRAYRPYLPDIPEKLRKRFRKIARRTNGGRDIEVQIPWVRTQLRYLTRNQRIGVGWLIDYLEKQLDEEYSRIRVKLGPGFLGAESNLRPILAVPAIGQISGPTAPPQTFAEVTADLIRRHREEVLALVDFVRHLSDESSIHQLRIGMKRLRYLLEPVAVAIPSVGAAVKHCKKVQDVLGELHDAQVMAAMISRSMALASVNRVERLRLVVSQQELKGGGLRRELARDECAGLLALIRRTKTKQSELLGEFEKKWLAGGMDALLAEILKVAEEVSKLGGPVAPAVSDVEPTVDQTDGVPTAMPPAKRTSRAKVSAKVSRRVPRRKP